MFNSKLPDSRALAALMALSMFMSVLLSACQIFSPGPATEEVRATPTSARPEETETLPSPTESTVETEVSSEPLPEPEISVQFAAFEEAPVSATASLQHEPIAADLSNVYNPFVLSPEQLERLGKEGIVVTPGGEKEFFTVYEKARYDNVPIFVTSDSLLHSYHLLFDKVLRSAEREHFIPLLQNLNTALLQEADAQYQALKGGAWEDAARRTTAFVAVAARLLDPQAEIPDYARELAEAELANIEAAAGIQPSPIFPGYEYGEDYTQYIPRGHYTLSDDLKAYFKSMMWYGRMTFRLKTDDPEVGRAETRQALLLVQALTNAQVDGGPALEAWADLYSPTVFFVGRSDDLTVVQYRQVMDAVFGTGASLEAITEEAKLAEFIEVADQLPPPKILGIVINASDDVEETTKGLRFMGQRFVPDAYIFRQLIYRNVSEPTHKRGLPNGLDLPAAMGSERAYEHLEAMGETSYVNYPEQMEKMRTWLKGLTVEEWTETLNNSWLYTFYPLLDVPGEGYPQFMQSKSWLDKQLNTVLGSWAELKHDTILYAKQAYAEMGGGLPPPEPKAALGYVEPVPGFYARLAALTAMTREGLESRGLLSEGDAANLQRLEELTRMFQGMAEKELNGQPLTEEEHDTIRFYGGDLEHFVMASADMDEEADGFSQQYMDEDPQAAVIADVATDPDADFDGVPTPVVLEVGVGRIQSLHAVVPVVQPDGTISLQVAKGGVISYYEFPWPAEDRLTDEKWRGMLDSGEAPDQPEWTGSFFTSQGESHHLQQAVQSYLDGLVYLAWGWGYYAPSDSVLPEGFEAYKQFEPELQELMANEQYMGRQLLGLNFLSYDLQEDRAVVTVREEWLDQLFDGTMPEYDVEPAAVRGPYTLEVTYTIERQEVDGQVRWQVVGVSVFGEPPAWE